MKQSVAAAISRYYPSKDLDVPDLKSLDPLSISEKIDSLISEISGLEASELDLLSSGDGPWEIVIYRPSKKEVFLQDLTEEEKVRIYNAGPKYALNVEISKRSAFFHFFWNSFQIVKGKFLAEYLERIEAPEWLDYAAKITKIIESKGLAKLDDNELSEEVPWIRRNDLNEKITVYHCLFSDE